MRGLLFIYRFDRRLKGPKKNRWVYPGLSGFKWVVWLPYWMVDSGCPKSKVQGRSTVHSPLCCCRAAAVPAAPIFSAGERLGFGASTRETSHDVSNNIRGEKSISAVFSEDSFCARRST